MNCLSFSGMWSSLSRAQARSELKLYAELWNLKWLLAYNVFYERIVFSFKILRWTSSDFVLFI
jgi:hypothetical protein